MHPRTIFLSRLIGVSSVLVSLSMAVHKQTTVETMNSLIHNAPLLFLGSEFSLIAGLAMVLSHNVWKGGAAPIIVTLVGWLTLIKSLLSIILLPQAVAFFESLPYERLFPVYTGIPFILGVYLTWAGFRPKSG